MRAAASLARTPIINDVAFGLACDAAFTSAANAVQQHLWNGSAGYYRAYTGGNALMSDATYALVLSDSIGLGPLVPDDHVASHLRAVLKANDTPWGLLAMTGRYPYPGPSPRHAPADNSIWMMSNPNWATLSLWRDGDVSQALTVARKALDWWRTNLTDTWNVVAFHGGLGYGLEGQPLVPLQGLEPCAPLLRL